MAAARGDATELLVVLVDERARVVVDVADRHAARSVGVAQPTHPGPAEDLADRRARMTGQRRQAVWPVSPADPGADDEIDLLGRQRARRPMRSRAVIEEAVLALIPIAANPLVRGRPADTLSLRGSRRRPSLLLDPSDEQLSPEHVEFGHTMGHECLLLGLVLNTPNRGARLSLVNNVCGHHI